MRAEPRHAAPEIGDPPLPIEPAEIAQQSRTRGQRALGRRVGEGQIGRRLPPGSAIQAQAGQLGLQNFRPIEGRQPAMQRRGP